MSEALTKTVSSGLSAQQLRRRETAWLFAAAVAGYALLAVYARHYAPAEPVIGVHIQAAMVLIYFVGVPSGVF
jgi:hypothetical protein